MLNVPCILGNQGLAGKDDGNTTTQISAAISTLQLEASNGKKTVKLKALPVAQAGQNESEIGKAFQKLAENQLAKFKVTAASLLFPWRIL